MTDTPPYGELDNTARAEAVRFQGDDTLHFRLRSEFTMDHETLCGIPEQRLGHLEMASSAEPHYCEECLRIREEGIPDKPNNDNRKTRSLYRVLGFMLGRKK